VCPNPRVLEYLNRKRFATNRIENITMKTEDLISIEDGSIPTNMNVNKEFSLYLPTSYTIPSPLFSFVST
jgi:hypothetical protein